MISYLPGDHYQALVNALCVCAAGNFVGDITDDVSELDPAERIHGLLGDHQCTCLARILCVLCILRVPQATLWVT